MFKNLYRTNQLKVDTSAMAINILEQYISLGPSPKIRLTDKVVAFIVKVKLVEKRVKRKVGIVIVEKVIR